MMHSPRQHMKDAPTRRPTTPAALRVGPADDAYEREADRAADAVVRGGLAPWISALPGGGVRRKCDACAKEDEATLRRDTVGGDPGGWDAPPIVGDVLRSPGRPLDAPLRAEMERGFGHDFSRVRVHDDAMAAESARAVHAHAYSAGHDVVFGAGQYTPTNASGRRLLAHELAHTLQQEGSARREVRRSPLDLVFDPCVTIAGRRACGSDAAKLCEKVNLPGCGAVCKAYGCKKEPSSKTLCPPNWRAATSKAFEGLCCQGAGDSERTCCPAVQISGLGDRCCATGEVPTALGCKRLDLPDLPRFCLPQQRTLLGECCAPPAVPQGARCALPQQPPPPLPVPPKVPAPAAPAPPPIRVQFKLDRPYAGEAAAALGAATTASGKAAFDALAATLSADVTLKVQLTGRASPEGSAGYNLDLGGRRARMVAAALRRAGVSAAQIADLPGGSTCTALDPGVATCGAAGATGELDRETVATLFRPSSVGAAPP